MRICSGDKMKDIDVEELANFYKMFSDPTRLKIIIALFDHEYSVNELENVVKMSQTAVSYQLRILRDAHIVKYRKSLPNIYYSIDDEHIDTLIKVAEAHLIERKV